MFKYLICMSFFSLYINIDNFSVLFLIVEIYPRKKIKDVESICFYHLRVCHKRNIDEKTYLCLCVYLCIIFQTFLTVNTISFKYFETIFLPTG